MRVLLVDDHHLFREGIRLILQNLSSEIEFLHAESCEAALAFEPADIELILLDFHLPGASDHDAIAMCRHRFPNSTLVVVSGEDNPATIRRVINDGAAGYIPKSSSPDVLFAALRLALAGTPYLPPHVLDEPWDAAASEDPVKQAIDSLSDRQKAVLARALQGKLNKVIASELNIAEGTVKAHLSAAFRAMGVHNRTEAVYLASRHSAMLTEVL
ncbi:MAG: response regulator transcription factor [Pseudomonadales bacterium]|nr:response regulator transcription factor [Pseudomonadales bacterium]